MTKDEAIKELRGFIGQLTEGCQEVIKVLIPELEESEDWREKRKEECPFRRNLDNNLYGCERYEGVVCVCDGTCSWVVDYPKLKEIQDKKKQEQPAEHPDNFTSFEWLIGRLMFRGCDLWGMTDGEDDNGVVTKLIKDRAAEMLELLERELDFNAEPVGLEEEYKEYVEDDPVFSKLINRYVGLAISRHFYELGLKARKEE